MNGYLFGLAFGILGLLLGAVTVKPRELAGLAQRNRMRLRDAVGVQVNPLNRRFTLSPRMPVNYMMVCTAERQ